MTLLEHKLNELRERGKLSYERRKPLSTCSTFRIGGKVDFAIYPKTEDGFIFAYELAEEAGMSPRVVGNASNILFPDEGYRGAIIFTTEMKTVRFFGNEVRAGAGVSLTGLAVKAMKRSLSGLEFGYGIPGTVGGAVYMNAGAYEHCMKEVLKSSRAYDPRSGKIRTLDADAHALSYRHSAYMENGMILLSAALSLLSGDAEAIRAVMDDYMERRKSKQPLDKPSAGSVFKRYPGYFTGKLIEEAGLKGYTVGGAQVSTKHAGFIVNVGGATAGDVKELVSYIQDEIYKRNGIRIERELIYF